MKNKFFFLSLIIIFLSLKGYSYPLEYGNFMLSPSLFLKSIVTDNYLKTDNKEKELQNDAGLNLYLIFNGEHLKLSSQSSISATYTHEEESKKFLYHSNNNANFIAKSGWKIGLNYTASKSQQEKIEEALNNNVKLHSCGGQLGFLDRDIPFTFDLKYDQGKQYTNSTELNFKKSFFNSILKFSYHYGLLAKAELNKTDEDTTYFYGLGFHWDISDLEKLSTSLAYIKNESSENIKKDIGFDLNFYRSVSDTTLMSIEASRKYYTSSQTNSLMTTKGDIQLEENIFTKSKAQFRIGYEKSNFSTTIEGTYHIFSTSFAFLSVLRENIKYSLKYDFMLKEDASTYSKQEYSLAGDYTAHSFTVSLNYDF